MKFAGPLISLAQTRVDACDVRLTDPDRLKALHQTGLLDSPNELAFDRLAHLAARILKVPLTIVSLVSDKKQFFKAAYGLPSPMDVVREIPIDGSICRYTLAGESIIAADASKDPLLMHHPATGPWGITAFIAIPMILPNGHVLGAFCAVDSKVREWSEEDVTVMKELTASVMTEINLRAQISELNFEKEIRERFVAALTHDLRTPLTASKMSAQIMVRNSSNSPQIQKSAGRISENMDRADRMIQDLLDTSQIKSGGAIPLDLTNCHLNVVAKMAVEDLIVVHGERFVLKASEEIQLVCDYSAVRRMIENLAANAIKYGSTNTPVTISLETKKEWLEIGVHNFGNPIPLSEQENIFEHFHRSASASQGSQKGWGIGLTLVRGLAEAHGGKIQLTSSQQDGTTFKILLPL